jgi:hypothetical protein
MVRPYFTFAKAVAGALSRAMSVLTRLMLSTEGSGGELALRLVSGKRPFHRLLKGWRMATASDAGKVSMRLSRRFDLAASSVGWNTLPFSGALWFAIALPVFGHGPVIAIESPSKSFGSYCSALVLHASCHAKAP